MRRVIYGFFGLLALQAPAMAASNTACSTVGREWHAAAFATPAKPGQARVQGSAGYETSGPGFGRMMQAIRETCGSSDPAMAVQQAAVAEALLHR
jgi:hypothetical protein